MNDDVYSFAYEICKVGKIRKAMNKVFKTFLQKLINEGLNRKSDINSD